MTQKLKHLGKQFEDLVDVAYCALYSAQFPWRNSFRDFVFRVSVDLQLEEPNNSNIALLFDRDEDLSKTNQSARG